jgi:hypothetical protein
MCKRGSRTDKYASEDPGQKMFTRRDPHKKYLQEEIMDRII